MESVSNHKSEDPDIVSSTRPKILWRSTKARSQHLSHISKVSRSGEEDSTKDDGVVEVLVKSSEALSSLAEYIRGLFKA